MSRAAQRYRAMRDNLLKRSTAEFFIEIPNYSPFLDRLFDFDLIRFKYEQPAEDSEESDVSEDEIVYGLVPGGYFRGHSTDSIYTYHLPIESEVRMYKSSRYSIWTKFRIEKLYLHKDTAARIFKKSDREIALRVIPRPAVKSRSKRMYVSRINKKQYTKPMPRQPVFYRQMTYEYGAKKQRPYVSDIDRAVVSPSEHMQSADSDQLSSPSRLTVRPLLPQVTNQSLGYTTATDQSLGYTTATDQPLGYTTATDQPFLSDVEQAAVAALLSDM